MNAESDAPGGFSQEKGTDYPVQPTPDQQGYPMEKGTEFPAGAPAQAGSRHASFLRSKLLWVSIAGVVVFAGIFGYVYLSRLPFRIKDGNIILRDSHGDTVEIATRPKLPETFPEDIPIFPDSVFQPSIVDTTTDDVSVQASLFIWQAPAPLEEVAFWYSDELPLRGWTITQRQQTDVSSLLITVTKDGRGFLWELKGVSSTRTDVSLIIGEEYPQ